MTLISLRRPPSLTLLQKFLTFIQNDFQAFLPMFSRHSCSNNVHFLDETAYHALIYTAERGEDIAASKIDPVYRSVRHLTLSARFCPSFHIKYRYDVCNIPVCNQKRFYRSTGTNPRTSEIVNEYDCTWRGADTQTAVENVREIFKVPRREAESIVTKCQELKTFSMKNALQIIDYLNDKGVTLETIKKNPWLLTSDIEKISSNLDKINQLDLGDTTAVISLLRILLENLRPEHEKGILLRIKYTCDKFQCSVAEASEIFVQYPFMVQLPMRRFFAITDLLLEAGVAPEHVLRDVWVFRYSTRNIRARLHILKEAGVTTIKPWMLRSATHIFENTVRRAISTKEVLGEDSVKEYLTKQLQCDPEHVDYITNKHPAILRTHVPRLKEILDFLFSAGYTPQSILLVPRILLHSIDTIRTRLMELRDAGYNPPSIMVLCKSKKDYARFLELVLKKKYKRNI